LLSKIKTGPETRGLLRRIFPKHTKDDTLASSMGGFSSFSLTLAALQTSYRRETAEYAVLSWKRKRCYVRDKGTKKFR